METLNKEKKTGVNDNQSTKQSKSGAKQGSTFTADNLKVDASTLKSSNKGQGPAGENL